MQKNHPKSNALRQTKICMAVAAVVTAAALPGYAVATPTWEETREARVTELTKAESGLTVVAENALLEKQTKLDNVKRYEAFARQVERILSDENVDDATKFSNLKPVAERIKVEVSRLVKVRGSDAANKAWHAEYEGFLTAFMRKVDDISSPAEIKSDHASSKALSAHVEKSAVDGLVDPAKTAVVEAQQHLELLKHKAASLGGAASEEEYKHLTEKTFLLNANAANAEKNSGVLTWNDKNLQTFVNETALAAGHDKIVQAATLEIGSFSGGASDAIHGVAAAQGIKTREIATLRALDGAKHDVQVVEGALNIHQFIETEGNGALSVTLGKKGVLHFEDQAKDARGGIKGDNVTLVAGSADVAVAINKADEGAKIAFGDGTSAGNAKIDLYSGASLEFNKGSDAGNSKITVARAVTSEDVADRVVEREAAMEANVHADLSALPELTEQLGAKLEFEDSSAGEADITNAGALTFTASDLSTAELKNVAGGTVTIKGKEVGVFDDQGNEVIDPENNLQKQEMKLSDGGAALVFNQGTLTVENTNLNEVALQSAGTTTIAKSKGGKATLANWLGGDLAISETQLQDMKLVNAGKATITESDGGKALIANLQDGELTLTDTKLQSLALANEGAVKMTGKTTATNASITLHGGSLDVSEIAITDIDAGAGKPENSLTIGSLTGKGDVVTGNTVLMLGELGNDDHFEGNISREAAKPGTQSYPNVLHANVLTSQPVGSNVVKVGTGNLTLSGDQSGVTNLSVQGGKLTAAHPNALGSGAVNVAKAGTIALSTDVSGVNNLQNDGTLDLGMNKLEVGTYASEAGAKIKSRIEKVEGKLSGGQIHVSESSDFGNTTLDVTAAADIEIQDLVDTFEVVSAEGDAEVTGVEFTVGSITGGKQPDPTIKDPDGPNVGPETPTIEPGTGTKITDKNIVKFLAADGGYSANEQAVLASVDGAMVGDLASGKIGGKVLSAMALQTAGTEEQRRSARMLSGESLVNNAVAAQAAATSFQRGMQTRMIAGGAMFDDKTANGAMVTDNGIAGWASFNGGKTSQRGDGMSFDVKGLDGAIGVDKRLNQNTLVGGSIGFGNQESKAKGLPGESKVNSVSVGLYGSHLTGSNWFVNGGASYTNHSVKTDRTVAARNASARVAGKTSGQTFGMFGEVGKRFEVSGVNIDPSVGVRVASTRLKAFDETNRDGSGNDGLKVGSQSQTSTRGVLGVRLWSEVASIAGGKVAPSLRLSYEHEFGKTQSSLTNAIYGAPSSFTVKGPKLGKDIFTADLGLDMQLKKQLEVRVGGNVSVRKGESALGGGISAKYRF